MYRTVYGIKAGLYWARWNRAQRHFEKLSSPLFCTRYFREDTANVAAKSVQLEWGDEDVKVVSWGEDDDDRRAEVEQ
jgi:hypothetical protein